MNEREDLRDETRDPETYEAPNVEDLEKPDGDAVVTAAGLTIIG
jgi:hypothetical protein